jgi:hypothetical protein
MLLNELTGVKSQANKTGMEILTMLKKEYGIKMSTGLYGVVLVNPKWDYVIKFFAKDDCYLKFVKYAMSHKNKHFPIFKKPPMEMKAFFRGLDSLKVDLDNYYAVKIEKLDPLLKSVSTKEYHALRVVTEPSFIEKYDECSNKETFLKDYLASSLKPFDLNPYRSFADAVSEVYSIKGSCSFDLHTGNMMWRGDTLVITDPFSNLWESGIPLNKIIGDTRQLTRNQVQQTVDTIARTTVAL